MSSRKKSKPNPPSLVDSTSHLASSAASGLAKIIGAAESRSEPNLVRSESNISAKSRRSEEHAALPTTSSALSTSSVKAQTDQKPPKVSSSWYGGTASEQKPSTPSPAPAPNIGGKDALSQSPDPKPTSSLPIQNRRSSALHLSPATSMRSQPLTGTTRLNISTDQNGQSEITEPENSRKKNQPQDQPQPAKKSLELDQQDANAGKNTETNVADLDEQVDKSLKQSKRQPTSDTASNLHTQAGWTTWFSRSHVQPLSQGQSQSLSNKQPQSKSQSPPRTRPIPNELSKDISSSVEASQMVQNETHGSLQKPTVAGKADQGVNLPQTTEPTNAQGTPERPRSWLGLWSGAKPNGSLTDTSSKAPDALNSVTETSTNAPTLNARSPEKSSRSQTSSKENLKSTAEVAGSGSSWAFWSRSPANPNKASVGELAVAGSPSQSSPQRALDQEEGIPQAVISTQSRKRGRPASLEVGEELRTSSAPPIQKKPADAGSIKSIPGTPQARPSSKRESSEVNNLLLPLFKQTFPYEADKATILQQLGQLFYGKPRAPRHPTLIREPTRIKRALTIGIHGYFPTPLVQTVIGRPTGTSIKFAEYAARAIHNYTQNQGYSPISVEKLALEGEGRIEERLDILWKLLLNWIDKIRHADFIILACHSQGVPVAISLAAKLIGFGCVNGARIGVCAMAGVNLGPFADYKSRWIGGSAGELFDFGLPDSSVSKAYETALDTLLRFGGKVLYVGSMDDQLVSLQSSTFGSAQHPNIYRAVWIDGRVHVSDFLTHLVGFALKVRNLGVSDHGLIRELSNPLAGSLVGGEGHSRLYEDPAVYDLAIEFIAGTSSVNTEVLKIDRSPSSTSQNPYILPFAVRGLLEEDLVRKQLSLETAELIKQFDDWKPTTKVLRDVKYRLEGVRSKL